MKNLAHFTFENESFAQYITDVTQRTRTNKFDDGESSFININRSFDDLTGGYQDQKIDTNGMSKAIENRKKRGGALQPHHMDLDVSGESP